METFLKAALNTISFVGAYILFNTILGRPNKYKKTLILSYGLAYAIVTFIYLYFGKPLILVASYFISFSLLSFNHSNKLAKNLLTSLLILGVFVLVENISIIFFLSDDTLNFQKIEADKVLVVAVSKILLLVVSTIIYTFFYPREKHIIPKRYYLLLPLLISISAIFTTSIILINDLTSSSKILLLVFLLINISVSFYIYYAMLGIFEEKNKQMALENQYELIKLQNESIKKSTEDLRRLEHDLKNKLTPIALMVKDENTDQASKYMEEILKEFQDKKIIRPSTVVEVDSIINVKGKICQDKNISFTYDISPLNDTFINHMDLAVIVGILLDNAIEAATKVNDSWIKLKLKNVKGLVLIEVENSFDGIVKKNGTIFLTRKENEEAHGMGIINLESILKKYSSKPKFLHSKNTFKVEILIYPL